MTAGEATTVVAAIRVVGPAMVIAVMIAVVVMTAAEDMRDAIIVEAMTGVVDTVEISDRFNERLFCTPFA